MPIQNATDLTAATNAIRNRANSDRANFKATQLAAIRAFSSEVASSMETQLAAHEQEVLSDAKGYTVDHLCDNYRDPDFHPNEGFTPWFSTEQKIACIDDVVGRCGSIDSTNLAGVSPELVAMIQPAIDSAKALGFRAIFSIRADCGDEVTVSVKLRAPKMLQELYGDSCLRDADRRFLGNG